MRKYEEKYRQHKTPRQALDEKSKAVAQLGCYFFALMHPHYRRTGITRRREVRRRRRIRSGQRLRLHRQVWMIMQMQ